MKLLVISDIHGIKTNLSLIEKKFKEFKCDTLIVLGDIYYNYGRNNQKDYDPEYVREFLKSFSDKLICLKGNCDENINSYLEPFDIIPDYMSMNINDKKIYFTHGHKYNKNTWYQDHSILISGHTHIPEFTNIKNMTCINPGSISLPLGKEKASYLLIDDNKYTIVDINDRIIFEEIVA